MIRSNYAFCVDWVLAQPKRHQVLDYGCGAGEIVTLLRERGIESYGCDVYYEGGDRSRMASQQLYERGILRRMEPHLIPFADGTFDIVISNQVLEHVEDLAASLGEISRVLKPGGKFLSLFPHREAWFEGHVGLPFIHWLRPGSRARFGIALSMRSLGLGFYKAGKPIAVWTRDALAWIDRWTHYRSRVDVERAFRRHFVNISRLESRWLKHKLGDGWISRLLPARFRQAVTIMMAGLVFECEKADQQPLEIQSSSSHGE